ncbi:MAG: cupin domain-containing protein [Planctomyces sp.]|nr:cupin domain-containing protein [Planctomyces sp.]
MSAPGGSRAEELRELLQLSPHPEGGWFRETFRSGALVQLQDGRGPRSAMTVIDFLLVRGEVSVWHVVRSDECWIASEGGPLVLRMFNPATGEREECRLGCAARDQQPSRVVPAGWWQSAAPAGDYSLVQCVVSPGFDFSDFRMIRDDASLRELSALLPESWRQFV